MSFIKQWNKTAFYALFIASILFIFFCWVSSDEHEEGTYSTEFDLTVDPSYRARRKIPQDSSGEQECRRVLEKRFKCSFPNIRPNFLQNRVTGQSLEIDCFNEQLKLGCEYNGKQHYEFVPHFHRSRDAFHNQKYRDDMKYRACEDYGVKLIIVPYTIPIPQIENYIHDKLRSINLK